MRDQVVDGDERREIAHEHVLGNHELQEGGRHHGHEDRDRRTRAKHQRRHKRQRQDNLLGARRDHRVIGEQSARDQLCRNEQHRDRANQVIACKRVAIEPAVKASEQRAKHKPAHSAAAGHVPAGTPATTTEILEQAYYYASDPGLAARC